MQTLMKCLIMRHFIGIFTVCKSIRIIYGLVALNDEHYNIHVNINITVTKPGKGGKLERLEW